MEPNGAQIVLIHPAIHGERERPTLGFEIPGQRPKCTVWAPIIALPDDADVFLRGIEAADDIGGAAIGLVVARLGDGRSGGEQQYYEGKREKPECHRPLPLFLDGDKNFVVLWPRSDLNREGDFTHHGEIARRPPLGNRG